MPERRAQVVPPAGSACLNCGYVLHEAAEERCPECGLRFDPADATSYRHPEAHPLRYFWTTPPPTWHAVAIAVATAILLEAGSRPHFGTRVILASRPTLTSAALIVVLAVALDYVKRAGRMAIRRLQGRRVRRGGAEAWRWVVVPVCGVVLGSAMLTDWPLRLRFQMSQEAFRGAVAQQVGSPGRALQPHWIGCYRVTDIVPRGSAVVLITHRAYGESLGFAHMPEGLIAEDEGETLRPIATGWYVYARR